MASIQTENKDSPSTGSNHQEFPASEKDHQGFHSAGRTSSGDKDFPVRDLREFYKEKIAHYTQQSGRIQKRLALISVLRLISFSGIALMIYFITKGFGYPLLFGSLFFLTVFIALVRLSLRLKDRRALLEKLLFVNINELGILNNAANGFPDGQAHLSSESYLDDLDIFGKRSLFHVLNRTTTSHGSQRLTEILKCPLQSPAEITRQQQALRELTRQVDKRQLMTANGLLTGEKEGNLYGMESWLATEPRLKKLKWLLVLRWILIVYNMGAILFYLDTNNYLPLLGGVIVSWAIIRSFAAYISGQHALIGKKQAILDQYAEILAIFNTIDSGESELLQQLRLISGKAHYAIRRLSQLSSFFDQRMNMLVNTFLNSFLLYDIQCMIALENWKDANKKDFPGWIEAVGSIECLNSLAAFAFNNPEYCYPSPVDSPGNGLPSLADSRPGLDPGNSFPSPANGAPLFLQAKKIAHPLIPAPERVPNDFTIGAADRSNNNAGDPTGIDDRAGNSISDRTSDCAGNNIRNPADRLILVTGSNMSGKTTFLRTIGVNLLLGQCGAPVCALSFSFTPMHILTSLRVSDSLQEHTSYFMAELKKLQQIIHRLRSGRPALVLIDEILRGTNSEDKTYGSEQFIRKLLQYNCLSLFATHDLSLGKLENEMPGLLANYCFESVIQQGELHFNYQLQPGIAHNRNASFLMEKMEII